MGWRASSPSRGSSCGLSNSIKVSCDVGAGVGCVVGCDCSEGWGVCVWGCVSSSGAVFLRFKERVGGISNSWVWDDVVEGFGLPLRRRASSLGAAFDLGGIVDVGVVIE